ncbi:zinc-dependent metalloprotease [Algivirga pacifica]|uniref:Por secretion system C-terminal sorting domain-containing protein n=1 Tax=Algivirga pacifica TaxID=1162670 RepID=A0ABP9DG56_9BACT
MNIVKTLPSIGLILLAILHTLPIQAQNSKPISCHQQEHRDELLSSDENRQRIDKAEQRLNEHTKHYLQQKASLRITEEVLTIPVVFHVVHNNGIENISDAQIIDAVDQLNEDFSATNPGVVNVIEDFQGIVADVGLQFRLAEKDPNGNPSSGITRTVSSYTTNGSNYEYEIKTSTGWPRDQYLNIWVVYSSDGNNGSGYAYYPSTVDDATNNYRDGVIVSHWAVGRTGTAVSTHYKLLTHEIGHWANLKHTWGDQTANGQKRGCNYDDDVADTPETIGSYSCETNVYSCNSLDNTQNYMDYSSCPEMFTIGQKDRMRAALTSSVAGRNNLWSASNLSATLNGGSDTPFIAFSSINFQESENNDGSISNSITVTLNNASFQTNNGILSKGIDYTLTGIPQGLNATLEVTTENTAVFSLTGVAEQHENTNDVSGITLTFLDAAITGGDASILDNPTTDTFTIDFRDAFQVVEVDITDLTVNNRNTWEPFTLTGIGNPTFGAWYDGGDLRLETYTLALICEGSSLNITPLSSGTEIGPSSNWIYGGTYPDEHYVRTRNYTVWDGQEAYIGFKVEENGEVYYGWFQAKVDSRGRALTIMAYAYNEQPNQPINAGQTTAGSAAGRPLLGLEQHLLTSFNVYPNPLKTGELLRIKRTLGNNFSSGEVEVYNLYGQQIIRLHSNQLEQGISTEGWKTGMYILRLTTADGQQKTTRVILR